MFVGTAPFADYVLVKTEKELSETPQEMYNWIAGAEYADSIADIINSSLDIVNLTTLTTTIQSMISMEELDYFFRADGSTGILVAPCWGCRRRILE